MSPSRRGLVAVIASFALAAPSFASAREPGSVVVLGWNDLGMHCYSPSFADMALLPPYNTLWAQVIQVGDPPRILTGGVSVSYFFADNATSAGKTDFWQYAQALFGVSLAADVGLRGFGLSGNMRADGDHFIAEGVPLTEYSDSAPNGANPYQIATIVVRDAATGQELARSSVVAPVSSEMRCDGCHADGADAAPDIATGKWETNVLTLHDRLEGGKYARPLMQSRPVLCAGCHADAALGTRGAPGTSSFSNAMHRRHRDLPDVTPDTEGCYNCHPGSSTRCLRDTMSTRFGFGCPTCHGTVATVSLNPTPWLLEPRCSAVACHGSGVRMDRPLYRQSRGHGGTYCAGCHDSPHAIAPSSHPLDGQKRVALQGDPGTLAACGTCHASDPGGAFYHPLRPAPRPVAAWLPAGADAGPLLPVTVYRGVTIASVGAAEAVLRDGGSGNADKALRAELLSAKLNLAAGVRGECVAGAVREAEDLLAALFGGNPTVDLARLRAATTALAGYNATGCR